MSQDNSSSKKDKLLNGDLTFQRSPLSDEENIAKTHSKDVDFETPKKPLSRLKQMVNPELEYLKEMLGERYEIDKELGKGGMGVVYLGWDKKLKRSVAIKTLYSEWGITYKKIERFRFEALVAASLQHPNIVQVYEVIDSGEKPIYIMEFVEGVELDKYVSKNKLAFIEIAKIMIQICKAVGFAHSNGIIHRDLKPANILITTDNTPKIMDFGLAKRIGEERTYLSSPLTVEGSVMGSPFYMSPEQTKGQIKDIDNRTDIYALGAILYKLLTGKTPFQGDSITAVIYQVVNIEPELLTKVNPSVPLDLEGICLKAMEKEPKDRYQTAYEMAQDLQNFIDGYPVIARRYTFWERAKRAIWQKRQIFAFSTITIWLIFILLFFFVNTQYIVATDSLTKELQIKMKNLANTGSMVMNGDVIDSIKEEDDLQRPEVKEEIRKLDEIKRRNDKIEYVWVMRPSLKKPGFAEVVIENDLLYTKEELDTNKNGIIDPEEAPQKVGDIYEETPNFPNLLKGIVEATSDDEINFADKWGVNLSGYAPIRNSKGEAVAIFGIDMKSDKVAKSFNQIKIFHRWILGFTFILAILFNISVFIWLVGLWKTRI